MKTKTILAIIPARGGSKRLPDKNIWPFAGTPLIAHTIKLARRCSAVDRIIVDTDSPKIATIARRYGAEVPFLRPAALAADDTPDLPVFQHALRALREADGYVPDAVVHLRPTQPLRTAEEIDRAVDLWLTSGADCVKAVRPVGEHPFKMYRLVGERLVPYLDTEERRRRGPDVPRQSLEPVYLSSGVVDVVRRETVEGGSTEGATVVPYFTEPSRYVNLDSSRDFLIAETIMRALGWEGEAR